MTLGSDFQGATSFQNGLFTRLTVGLSHFDERNRKHSFQDTFNPISNCGEDIENSSHCFLHCPDYLQERIAFWNTVSCIVPNISQYFLKSFSIMKKMLVIQDTILDTTISYLTETKRFHAQLFWCSPDVMVLTLILISWLHIFLLFLFCFYYYYPVTIF